MSLTDDTKATRRLPKWLLGLAALAVVAALVWYLTRSTGEPSGGKVDEAVPQPDPAVKTPAAAPATVPIEKKAGA